MRLSLDTQIVYRTYYAPQDLPPRARQLMMEAEEIFVSSVVIWEIAIKTRIGKINANAEKIVEKIRASGFEELPVTYEHALQVVNLPLYHADPFDRLLVIQAIEERISLLTTDRLLSRYSDFVIHV